MPTYSFFCSKCKYKDEVYLPISKRNIARNCPNCLNILNREIGQGKTLIFKGSGFYETDYKKNKK